MRVADDITYLSVDATRHLDVSDDPSYLVVAASFEIQAQQFSYGTCAHTPESEPNPEANGQEAEDLLFPPSAPTTNSASMVSM